MARNCRRNHSSNMTDCIPSGEPSEIADRGDEEEEDVTVIYDDDEKVGSICYI